MPDGSPSITVCNKASASGVATIDLSSVLDSDLNEQQWREAEADYCSRLLDGQAEAMSLREVRTQSEASAVCVQRAAHSFRRSPFRSTGFPPARLRGSLPLPPLADRSSTPSVGSSA